MYLLKNKKTKMITFPMHYTKQTSIIATSLMILSKTKPLISYYWVTMISPLVAYSWGTGFLQFGQEFHKFPNIQEFPECSLVLFPRNVTFVTKKFLKSSTEGFLVVC